MAATLADCDAMLAAARRDRRHARRRQPAAVLRAGPADEGRRSTPARSAARSSASSRCSAGATAAYYRSDPWRGKWDTEGGGVLVNQSPHQLDLLQWLMGDGRGGQRLLGQPQPSRRSRSRTRPWPSIRFRSGGLGLDRRPACRRSRACSPRSTSTARTAPRSASRPTAARRSSPACPTIAEPPLNDLWTIPGEEHLLAEFQAEDRAAFRQIDATTHYHALQIQDFLRADPRGPAAAGDGRGRPHGRRAVHGDLPLAARPPADRIPPRPRGVIAPRRAERAAGRASPSGGSPMDLPSLSAERQARRRSGPR